MKIGIVNDLPCISEALRRTVESAEHRVSWMAQDGSEAVARCAEETPDLVLMDLIMPGIDGVEATRQIMRATPCAILVVTATVDGRAAQVFEALGAGALDAIATPTLGGGSKVEKGEGARALMAKISMIGKLIGASSSAREERLARATRLMPKGKDALPTDWLIALGTSAGGPSALAEVLRPFSRSTPAAFIAVPHIDRRFASGLVEWLGKQIDLSVRLAREGDRPEPGVVFLPSREDHLILNAEGALSYTSEPIDYVYRPSVDAFFESIAAHWRGSATGVLLTGMGRDGALGLKKMRDAGFTTIAQDQASSAVYGMPKAAVHLGAASATLPLSEIGPTLQRLLKL